MKQISWKIRKRVLESPGFSVNFFCGNPKKVRLIYQTNKGSHENGHSCKKLLDSYYTARYCFKTFYITLTI